MPGTRAGAQKAWEKRHREYGPSGRKHPSESQTLAKSSKKSGSSKRTSAAKSENALPDTVLIDDKQYKLTRFNQYELDRLQHEQGEMQSSLDRLDNMLAPSRSSKLPGYILEIYRDNRTKLRRYAAQRKKTISIVEKYLGVEAKKKHGRRYS
jgi:hypothetical protein